MRARIVAALFWLRETKSVKDETMGRSMVLVFRESQRGLGKLLHGAQAGFATPLIAPLAH